MERSLPVSILLTIITCGIYGIYWFIVLTDEVNQHSGEDDTSGGIAFLLTLVTCGIYDRNKREKEKSDYYMGRGDSDGNCRFLCNDKAKLLSALSLQKPDRLSVSWLRCNSHVFKSVSAGLYRGI